MEPLVSARIDTETVPKNRTESVASAPASRAASAVSFTSRPHDVVSNRFAVEIGSAEFGPDQNVRAEDGPASA